ncbi:MAG TPA: fused MFS/spermidine synthase [Kineosporiaceae bacterium]|nr:fused MFS/spermidine synthase [Kineosporiaceae bacterium]
MSTGVAGLVPDGDGRRGWTLLVNGVPSSHVDLDDPLRLDFEYMRWIGDLLDVAVPEGEPMHALHLGGAGCTLARYLSATRPSSRQLVVEIDPELIELARQAFGLRSTPGLRMRAGDAREVMSDLPGARYDVVIRDAFAHIAVPQHLTTRGFLAQVARVLTPGGIYVANIGDSPGLAHARSEAATALDRFANVIVVAEPAQLRGGRRYGNVVLAASDAALPVAPLGRRLASGAVRARMLEDDEVRDFAAGRRPIEDLPG